MESKYRYQFTEKAENDLDSISRYIALELANPAAAAHFMDRLQECIERICQFPESGSIVTNEFLPYSNIRKKVVNNYVMYYMLDSDEEKITVLRIVYGRQNMDEIWN